jgi:hypothetical protein
MTTSVWFCTSPCWIWRLECKKNVPKLKNMGADNSPDDFWYHRRIPFRDSMFHGSKSSSLTICWSGPLLKTWFLLVNHLSKDPMFCWLIFLCWLKSQFSQLKHLFKKTFLRVKSPFFMIKQRTVEPVTLNYSCCLTMVKQTTFFLVKSFTSFISDLSASFLWISPYCLISLLVAIQQLMHM